MSSRHAHFHLACLIAVPSLTGAGSAKVCHIYPLEQRIWTDKVQVRMFICIYKVPRPRNRSLIFVVCDLNFSWKTPTRLVCMHSVAFGLEDALVVPLVARVSSVLIDQESWGFRGQVLHHSRLITAHAYTAIFGSFRVWRTWSAESCALTEAMAWR